MAETNTPAPPAQRQPEPQVMRIQVARPTARNDEPPRYFPLEGMPDGSVKVHVVGAFDKPQKLAGVKCSSSSNTLYTATQAVANCKIILCTVSGVSAVTAVQIYHRIGGEAKADANQILLTDIPGKGVLEFEVPGLAPTDVLTVDVGTTNQVIAALYGTKR